MAAHRKHYKKTAAGWYYRMGRGAWKGPYVTKHVASQMRAHSAGDEYETRTGHKLSPSERAWVFGNRKKRRWGKKQQRIRDRSRHTRVGSRHRDPKTGRFA